jgi:hypothetical protein
MIFSYNPVSMWGVFRLSKFRNKTVPWNASSIKKNRLIDWMNLLDFVVIHHRFIMFRPPVLNPAAFKKLRFLEWIGHYLWPFLGSINMVVGKKLTVPLTPMRLRNQLAKLVNGTIVATNSSSNIQSKEKNSDSRRK